MSVSAISVNLWGQRICAIAVDEGGQLNTQFDPQFLKNNLDIAPISLPLEGLRQNPNQIRRFNDLPERTFRGLPAFLVDSLPDDFGNALVNQYMASKGILPRDVTVLDRLAYTGKRAMGAFEFEPASKDIVKNKSALEMSNLVEMARRALTGNLEDSPEQSLQDLLSVGTSAGGARAKAVIAWNPKTNEVFGGQFDAPPGSEHWLLKFDGVGEDTELGLSEGYGKVEYAYYLMAKAAGIDMTESKLFEENGRSHFMTKRFDRVGNQKIFYQSLCGLMEMDFKQKGAHDYQQYLRVINALNLGHDALSQAFRRIAFNIMARNCDDHTKNFGFLMGADGMWSLAPAYDVMYAYNPKGEWTYQHLCSINGKFDGHTRADLLALAKQFDIKNAALILDQVQSAVGSWKAFAQDAGVGSQLTNEVQSNLRLL
jgi:serine/threonine-protein kinase HipA